jgi:hypothetical protein
VANFTVVSGKHTSVNPPQSFLCDFSYFTSFAAFFKAFLAAVLGAAFLTGADVFFGAVVFTAAFLGAVFFTALLVAIDSYYEPK